MISHNPNQTLAFVDGNTPAKPLAALARGRDVFVSADGGLKAVRGGSRAGHDVRGAVV